MNYQITYRSPIGNMMIVCDADRKYITGVWIEGQKYFQATLRQEPIPGEDISVLQKAANWLDAYFAGKKPQVSDLPLAPEGGEFRQDVWKILCEIPYDSNGKGVAIKKGNQDLLNFVNAVVTKVVCNGDMAKFIEDANALADQSING